MQLALAQGPGKEMAEREKLLFLFLHITSAHYICLLGIKSLEGQELQDGGTVLRHEGLARLPGARVRDAVADATHHKVLLIMTTW